MKLNVKDYCRLVIEVKKYNFYKFLNLSETYKDEVNNTRDIIITLTNKILEEMVSPKYTYRIYTKIIENLDEFSYMYLALLYPYNIQFNPYESGHPMLFLDTSSARKATIVNKNKKFI